jgi:Subtilase family
MSSLRPLGSIALRGFRHRIGVPALLLGVGILSLATTQGWATGRNLPDDFSAGWYAPARQTGFQDNPVLAPGMPQQEILRLAAKAHVPHAAPPPAPPKPQQVTKPTEPKPSQVTKPTEPKPQQAAKPALKEPEPKSKHQPNAVKKPLKDLDNQPPSASKPASKEMAPALKLQQQDAAKKLVKEPETKPHNAAKHSHPEIDSKERLLAEAKRLAKEKGKDGGNDGKHHKPDTAKEDAKESGKHHKPEMAKEDAKESGKHHKLDAAKADAKDSGTHHKHETAKEGAKEPGKHHEHETAKYDAKDSGKHHKPDSDKADAKEAAHHHKLESAKADGKDSGKHHHKHDKDEAKPQAPSVPTQAAAAAAQPVTPPPAVAPPKKPALPASDLPPIPASTPAQNPAPAQTDTIVTDAKSAADAKTAQDLTKVADGPQFETPMMKAGAPVDRDNKDDGEKTKVGEVKKLVDDKVQGKKPGEKVGGFKVPALPPPPDTYKQDELLMAKPSRKLLEEMDKRHYKVTPIGPSGLAKVTLTPEAPRAWDVQRELQANFTDQNVGLNFIYKPYYKPYHPQDGSKSPLPALNRNDVLALIGWEEKQNLAACAVGVKVGMIDTFVSRNTHPTFAKTNLESVNLALKQDAPPAPHWHATGVLSVMAGLPRTSMPALIPDAEFTAVNVFFTNKDGQLETDTAHLTEALAYLSEKRVQIVNMSLSGPKDALVHARIVDMAQKGVVFVAAAGNGGPDAPPSYPAAYEQVIAVTAVDRKGGNYDHANRGAYIDVAAPGVQIRAALPEGKEGALSGTSFAAPFVTALAAIAYRDSGLDRAVRSGQAPLDPKGMMLAQLLGKNELKKRDPVYGHGLIKAPEKCGEQRWMSSVTAAPLPASALAPGASAVSGSWFPSVTPASMSGHASGHAGR